MEPEKSTTRSSESCGTDKFEFFELPDWGVRADPPLLTLPEFLEANRKNRLRYPNAIPTDEERLAAKINVVFEI